MAKVKNYTDPNLYYDEKDENGKVRRFFLTHPEGNRAARRSRQRHLPFFTKATIWSNTEGLTRLGRAVRQARLTKRRAS